MPKLKNLGKLSRLLLEILNPCQAKTLIMIKTMVTPTNPVSSAKIANTESPMVSGKNSNFCLEWPSPTPVMPPEPMLIKA